MKKAVVHPAKKMYTVLNSTIVARAVSYCPRKYIILFVELIYGMSQEIPAKII